jgi:hypothetical protein
MFDHVYVDDHPLVAEERRWFTEYHASFVTTGPEEGRP